LNAQKKTTPTLQRQTEAAHPKSADIATRSTEKILATAFCNGRRHDFQLFTESRSAISPHTRTLADTGYQGLTKIHLNSQTPAKKTKLHPLSPAQKANNRALSRERILIENIIRRLKIFRILSERYRNRRKRFGLRFNLIAAIYNIELEDRR